MSFSITVDKINGLNQKIKSKPQNGIDNLSLIGDQFGHFRFEGNLLE